MQSVSRDSRDEGLQKLLLGKRFVEPEVLCQGEFEGAVPFQLSMQFPNDIDDGRPRRKFNRLGR